MDKGLLDWVSKQVLQGAQPLEIAAAVAREIAKAKALPIDGSQPSLLDVGSLHAPEGINIQPI